jgi:ubiquinone biosynthesis protein UbiJ
LWYHFISLRRWGALRHRRLVRRIRALRCTAAATAVTVTVRVVDVVVVFVGHCQCKSEFMPSLLDAVLQAMQATLHAIEISLDNVEMGLEIVQK